MPDRRIEFVEVRTLGICKFAHYCFSVEVRLIVVTPVVPLTYNPVSLISWLNRWIELYILSVQGMITNLSPIFGLFIVFS